MFGIDTLGPHSIYYYAYIIILPPPPHTHTPSQYHVVFGR